MNNMADKEILHQLYEIQYTLTYKNFTDLFGSNATFLWQKFVTQCSYNLLNFSAILDVAHKEIFLQYINNTSL